MTRPLLEQRLREDAARMRQAPSPDLHDRILAGLPARDPARRRAPSTWLRRPWAPALVAAAALLVVASIWALLPRSPGSTGAELAAIPAGSGDVVELSRDLLNPPLLGSVGHVEDPLMAEARNLWADTSRAAGSVARGLRTPWRLRTDGE